MKKITSRENPQYRHLLALARSGKARREHRQILLDGPRLVEAYAAAYGPGAITLVVRASSVPEFTARLSAARDYCVVADGLFNALTPVDAPVGVLAVAPLPTPPARDGTGLVAFLDGIQDPGNLGAILRSAAAAGASHAVLSADCADPWSPKCLRGGMGAQFALSLQDHRDLPTEVRSFCGAVLAADPRAAQSLFEAEIGPDPIAVVVGGEGKGVSPEVLALCTQRLQIPMAPGIESLNAGVAAALLFYEWRRRRRPDAG